MLLSTSHALAQLGVWQLGVWQLGVWQLEVWQLGLWQLGLWQLGLWQLCGHVGKQPAVQVRQHTSVYLYWAVLQCTDVTMLGTLLATAQRTSENDIVVSEGTVTDRLLTQCVDAA